MLDPTDTATPEPEADPYIVIETPSDPAWTASELEGVLANAFATGIPDVLTMREHYRELMLQADDDCPLYEDQNNDSWVGVWASECTADSGTEFFGTALYQEQHGTTSEDGEEYRLDLGMVASFELTDATGSTFTGGGGFILARGPIEFGISWSAQIGGTYHYPAAGGWLGEGIEAGLYLDGLLGVRNMLTIDGGIGWSGVDLYFHEMTFDSYTCDLYPEGTLSVRDEDGYWYDMTFACEPCAQLMWGEQDLGEVCPGEDLVAAVQADMARMGGEVVEP